MTETKKPLRLPRKHGKTGSEVAPLDFSDPEYLIVGHIVRPHGVRGEVGMKTLTDFPQNLAKVETLYLGQDYSPFGVTHIRHRTEGFILKLEGVESREQAESLRGMLVHIGMADAVPLNDGEIYLYQLKGIRVVTDTGLELGRVIDLIETGANDVYVITGPDQREMLIPAIPDVILRIDTVEHVMVIHLLDGLI